MNYDCHLEVCSLTPRDQVDRHLRRWKPSGVVVVLKGTDPRSRTEWMDRLDDSRGAFGVARVNLHDLHSGFSGLTSKGACGALLMMDEATSKARQLDDLLDLHDALPRHWHIELALTWNLAARLAPHLARLDRTFCLTPQNARASLNANSLGRVLRWFAMGNVHLKLTGGPGGPFPFQTHRQVCAHVPDRVVLGSGEPIAIDDHWWLEEDLIAHEQADDNAKRLYPFFRSCQLH